jgi:ankyrin repeat protein
MQTKTKPDIFEIMASTPGEATELLWGELNKVIPDLQVIEDILAYTLVDVNVQNEDGMTALILAVSTENEKYIEPLLNHPGIKVNLQDKWGNTALRYAAEWGREKVVELLLKHPGINVNLRDERGWTAWNLATISIRRKFPQLNPNS